MTDEEPASPAPTVRATRMEIVDPAGRVRLLVGNLGPQTESDGPYGVAVLDPHGRQRIWVALHETGPALAVDQQGNVAIQLGVDDETADAMHVGAYLHLADSRGVPVASWRVERDGSLTLNTPDD
jgi:hypothetical protein